MPYAVRTLVWLLVLGALGEIGLRLAYSSPKTQFRDPHLEIVRAPSRRLVHAREGFSWGRVNADGHVDGPPRPGSPRVLALGDSYTEGLQVPPERRFSELLAAALDVDVVNAGQSGWSPAHVVRYLEREGGRLAPDGLLVQVNDGDLPGLVDPARLHVDVRDPVCAPRLPDGFSTSGPAAWLDTLSGRSALVYLATSRMGLLLGRQLDRLRREWTAETRAPTRDAGVPTSQRAAMRACLARLAAHPQPLAVLYVPRLNYGPSGACRPSRPEVGRSYRALGEGLGIVVVDPTQDLCGAYATTGQPLHGFHNGRMGEGHLNEAGHRVVAEALEPVVGAWFR